MLFVLSGPSTVGKSYCVEYLCGVFDFKTLTPYTTRQPRISESEGFHYHFRSLAELRSSTSNFSNGYWDRPLNDGHFYGYTAHVESLSDDPRNWVIQASTGIGLAIKAKVSTTILVFLDFADDDTLRERILQRYSTSGPEVVARRLQHAEHERLSKNRFDYSITSNSPEQIARELLRIILLRSSALPQRQSNLPGPLSDVDLRSSLEAPDGLRIEGVPKDSVSARLSGWSIDLTLAPRFYRVSHPRFYRRVFDLARGDRGEILKRFRECVASEGAGIYLKSQEFILASTVERVSLPPRMVCLVSGRSSYARMGISIELSQIVLQPGHDDAIPLQLKNNMPYPIIIYPGISIAQAVFFQTVSPSGSPYNAQARAKYPRHVDDIRSRYYLDPAYNEIRQMLPARRPFDWDHLLNGLLLIVAWLTAASWIVARVPDPMFSAAGRSLEVVFFSITTLTLIVRFITLLRRTR